MTRRLEEFGDFECPYCGQAFGAVEQVRARLGEGLEFTWRHFPLAEVHPHAEAAARAAEAARAQGAFWPMHAALFADQRHLADADLVERARTLGLDLPRFEDDLASAAVAARVRADQEEGERRGVQGTPTFFVDGERYGGFYDLESLLDALA